MSTDRPVIREIFTKAVCGDGTLLYQETIDLEIPENADDIQVLGTYISRSELDSSKVVEVPNGKAVQVRGFYNVHVWYAVHQDTRSVKRTVNFIEHIPIKILGGDSTTGLQSTASHTRKPYCRKAYVHKELSRNFIRVEVEQDLETQVIGYTKLKVAIDKQHPTYTQITGIELKAPEYKPGILEAAPEPSCDYKCDDDPCDDLDDNDYDEYNV